MDVLDSLEFLTEKDKQRARGFAASVAAYDGILKDVPADLFRSQPENENSFQRGYRWQMNLIL